MILQGPPGGNGERRMRSLEMSSPAVSMREFYQGAEYGVWNVRGVWMDTDVVVHGAGEISQAGGRGRKPAFKGGQE